MKNSSKAISQVLSSIPVLSDGEHPIEKMQYRINTVAVEELLNKLFQWIEVGTPGSIICGPPRIGKTEAIEIVIDLLPDLLQKNIPMKILDCGSYANSNTTEAQFYDDILINLGYGLSKSRVNAKIKLNRIVDYVEQYSRDNDEFRFIYFLDEAQCLSDNHFQWLLGIHNRLNLKGIRLYTFSVGQPELLVVRSMFATAGSRQIIGRFMVGQHLFHGIQTEKELETILSSIDTLVYPSDSDCSYTKYYLPISYQKGFRLGKYSKKFIACFEEEFRNAVALKSTELEIPMAVIPPIIAYVLRELSALERAGQDVELDSRLIKDAIEYSEFLSLIQSTAYTPASLNS